jgi:hypothetical protein
VREESVPENIRFAVPWAEVEKKLTVLAAVKKIRGKLNVPRALPPDGVWQVPAGDTFEVKCRRNDVRKSADARGPSLHPSFFPRIDHAMNANRSQSMTRRR